MDKFHEKRILASRAIRKASVENTKEDRNLEKEVLRLKRQLQTQADQLKAAQNRFSRKQLGTAAKKKPIERKTSCTLPPVMRDRTQGFGELASDAKRHRAKSLPILMETASADCELICTRLPPLRQGNTRLTVIHDTEKSSGEKEREESREPSARTEKTAASLPAVPRKHYDTLHENVLQPGEGFSEDWLKLKPQEFHASPVLAKVQFVTDDFTKVPRHHGGATADSINTSGEALNDRTETERMFDDIKHCRYLRKPGKTKAKES